MESTSDGAAVSAINTNLTLDSHRGHDNIPMGPTGFKYDGGGGGVSVGHQGWHRHVVARRSATPQFDHNISNRYGGGLLDRGPPRCGGQITGSLFTNNSRTLRRRHGHLQPQGDVTDREVDLTGNDGGTGDGGGAWFDDSYSGKAVKVVDSTISANKTTGGGGGISFSGSMGGPSQVISTTVTGNTAAREGASSSPTSSVPGPSHSRIRRSPVTRPPIRAAASSVAIRATPCPTSRSSSRAPPSRATRP